LVRLSPKHKDASEETKERLLFAGKQTMHLVLCYMTIESDRTLGGIGAVLMLVGPFAGVYTAVIGLVGLILVLVALNGLANYYKERGVFNNAIIGVFATIIGVAIAVVVVVYAAFGIMDVLGIHVSLTDWSAVQNFNYSGFTDWNALVPYIAAAAVAWIILVASLVVAAVFLRRSLNTLSEKTGTHMFATTGLIILIGAALTIVFIGLALLWVSLILLAIAFFQIKTEPTQPQTTPSPP
jgi:uncharacterized membrane protein